MFCKNRWIVLALVAGAISAGACDDDDPIGPGNLAAPENVTATPAPSGIVVSWEAASGADSYTVERCEVDAGCSYAELASGVTGTTYTDERAEMGIAYRYRVFAVNAAGTSVAEDTDTVTIEVAQEFLTGNICGNCERTEVTLDPEVVYVISGIVRIGDGGVIHIPAGTMLVGNLQAAPSALIVERGGQIFSEGTEDEPVVFTSQRVLNPSLGDPRGGDWGGVVLNGTSYCNFPEEPCVAEGGAGSYGPGGDFALDGDDSSGRIVYTRIEYGGYEVSFGNELNALTLNAVGRGTEIHHVQTHAGLDDGFEWFGGTVDAHHLIATDISDDSFDFSTGWQGRGQFWIAQQDPNDADTGYEVDGNDQDGDYEPFTNPSVYNVTLVGKGDDPGVAGESTTGMVLRLGAGGTYRNHIVLGFGTAGIDIDNTPTVTRLDDGLLELTNSIVFDNAFDFSDDADGIDEEDIVLNTAGWENRVVDPELADPYDRQDPDFRPVAGSPALDTYATPPDDDFFDTSVDFIGAVGAGSDEWYKAPWTRWGS